MATATKATSKTSPGNKMPDASELVFQVEIDIFGGFAQMLTDRHTLTERCEYASINDTKTEKKTNNNNAERR